jgi:hypothetical protein
MPRPLELEKWGLLGGGRGLAKATRNFAILIFTLTHSVVISNNVPDIWQEKHAERGGLLGPLKLEEGACREGGACWEGGLAERKQGIRVSFQFS